MIRRCKQMEGCNVREVQLTHGQQYVGIDQPLKELQECRVQMGVPHQEGVMR